MTRQELEAALGDRNVQAFLHVIRKGEAQDADDDYTILNGGAHFSDFSKHPGYAGGPAAGAYQFVYTTWQALVSKYGFEDFSPRCQDLGAVALIDGRGALDFVGNGMFDEAVSRLRTEWTSLPGAAENKRWTMDTARDYYLSRGGELQSGSAAPTSSAPLLSAHFSYAEGVASQTAARMGIDNTPSPEIFANMQAAAAQLELVRTVLNNNPIIVSSWYRSPGVNAAVGGAPSSAHLSGWAIDFTCPGFGPLLDVVVAVANCNVPYDQVIFEYDSWCHISFYPTLRGQVLTIRQGTGYMEGIILPATASAPTLAAPQAPTQPQVAENGSGLLGKLKSWFS